MQVTTTVSIFGTLPQNDLIGITYVDVTMYLSWTQHSDPISNFMPQETSPNSNENDEAFFVDESEHSLDFPLLAADYEE